MKRSLGQNFLIDGNLMRKLLDLAAMESAHEQVFQQMHKDYNKFKGRKRQIQRVALAQLGFSPEDLDRSEAAKRHSNRGVLWGGVITAMSGLALLLGLATLGTGAWLLAGLLPLFVGLGMVLIYFLTLGASPLKEEAVGCTGEDLVEAIVISSGAMWPDSRTRFVPASIHRVGEGRSKLRSMRTEAT